MDTERGNYPWHVIALAQGASLITYLLGVLLLRRLHWGLGAAYLLYVLVLERRLLRGSCRHCYYYGRRCGMGRGRLCGMLFPRGDLTRFAERTITLRSMIPDLLVTVIPLLAGIVILLRGWSLTALLSMLALVFLATAGNGLIRGRLVCPRCRQRILGCPAAAFFGLQDGARH